MLCLSEHRGNQSCLHPRTGNTAAASSERQRALEAREFIPRFWAQKQEGRPSGQPRGSEAVLLLSPDTQYPGICGPGWPRPLFLMRQCTHQRARSQGPKPQHPPCRLLTFTGVQLPAGPTPRSQSPFSGPSRPLLTSHLQHPSSLSPTAPVHGRHLPLEGASHLGVSLTTPGFSAWNWDGQPPRPIREGPCPEASGELRAFSKEHAALKLLPQRQYVS